MDNKQLINFLQECIDNLKTQKKLLEERYEIMRECADEEFMLNKPVSKYQERKEYFQNIKQTKLSELYWDILSIQDKIYGYESQIEMTKDGSKEKTE